MALRIHSPAFGPGQEIPVRYTCDGANVSPSLTWQGVSAEAGSLALIVEDPDAPRGTVTHWVLFDIPINQGAFPEDFQPGPGWPGRTGKNTHGGDGYIGPCPPGGQQHRYFFRLYALDQRLELNNGASRAEVEGAMKDHVMEYAEYMGTYTRQSS